MFHWIKRLFSKPSCALCGKRARDPIPYRNSRNEPVVVCRICSDYAERRAYRKR